MQIGKLDYVIIRDIWRHEAVDFTTWLANNMDYLSDALGFTLNFLDKEKQIGSFTIDIFCEDEQGNLVIIENQLEKTDHKHLGQILTYAVGVDAKTVIWISPDPRTEHMEVIEWLNDVTPVDMSWYLIKLEAVKIGDSPVAPLFTVVAGPSQERKEKGNVKKDEAERHQKRLRLWEGLLPVLNEKTSLFQNISPSRDNWLATTTGVTGIYYYIAITMDSTSLKVVLKTKNNQLDKKIFDYLHERRGEIELAFGSELNWRRMDNYKSSRIECNIEACKLRDESTWKKGHILIAETLIKLDAAFRPHFEEIRKMRKIE